jgi:small subunit ribosomal protein S8
MDRVADLLIRIKNGYMANLKQVAVVNTKLSQAILTILRDQGYVGSFKVDQNQVLVELVYVDKKAVLNDVKRVSKPGRRVYVSHQKLPKVLNGHGLAIISTPKGVMTDTEARKQVLGGEVMAFVW